MNSRAARILEHWRRAPEVITCVGETPDFGRIILGYLGLRDPSYPFTVHLRTGEKIRIETHHDLVTLWVIFFRGEYEVPGNCTTIVDAGANIGAFSVYAARRAPQSIIHALEPFPSTRERLQFTLTQNKLDERVKVYPFALADSSVGATRHMSEEGPSQSRGTTTDAVPDGVVVHVNSLENFLNEANISSADLLKMDIEGAEHEVIHGSSSTTLRRFKRIALEYHPDGSAEALFGKLAECGFACTSDVRVQPDSGVAHFTLGPTKSSGSA